VETGLGESVGDKEEAEAGAVVKTANEEDAGGVLAAEAVTTDRTLTEHETRSRTVIIRVRILYPFFMNNSFD